MLMQVATSAAAAAKQTECLGVEATALPVEPEPTAELWDVFPLY